MLAYCRTRDAEIFPLAGADDGVDDFPAGAAHRAGQRLRRQNHRCQLGIVDEDGGTQAIKIHEAFDSVRANMRTFEPIYYNNEQQAREMCVTAKFEGAVIIPPQYSRRVYEQNQPRIALVVDNSDNFMSSTLEDEMTSSPMRSNDPTVQPHMMQQTALQIVELYPYIDYMKYLLPGSITLAMFCLGDDRRRHALY